MECSQSRIQSRCSQVDVGVAKNLSTPQPGYAYRLTPFPINKETRTFYKIGVKEGFRQRIVQQLYSEEWLEAFERRNTADVGVRGNFHINLEFE